MKYLQLAIALVFFWSNSFSQNLPTITIDAFNNLNCLKFDPVNGVSQPITAQLVQTGFEIQVMNISGIEIVKTKNAGGAFNNVTDIRNESNSKFFKIVAPAIENDGKTLLIQLIKNGEAYPKILTITIELSASPIVAASTTCHPDKLPQNTCTPTKNYDNFFGEDAKYYDRRKIVYVYDFNKDPSKREFYKITKRSWIDRKINKSNTNQLKIKVVNFNKETITSGKNVKFKIYNVNKFMYDVSIADSVIHFDSEPSAMFTRLFLGDSTLLSSLMGSFSNEIGFQNASDGIKKLSNDIKCFLEKYNWLQNQLLNAYDPCYSFPCCYSIEYIEIANTLIAIRADAVKIQLQIEDKKKTVADNKKKMDDCDKVKADIKVNDEKIKSLKTKATLSETEKKDLAELEKKQQELNDKICKDADYNGYKEQKMKAENELSDMSATSTLLSNLPSDQELRKVIVFLRNMIESNNSHTSDYISLNGNMLDLTIKIASKDSLFKFFSIPEYKNDPIQIQIPIICKPFVSFSSGSFIALGKNMQNKTYAWQEILTNSNTIDSLKYTLVESGYTLPPAGLCALGNLEWKLSRYFGLGGSIGVGLTIEKSPRLAYLGGFSLFFGDLRQFTVTGGFAGIQANKLSYNFQTISDNQIVYSSKPNIEYYNEFKVGCFISITYTPFKIYKSKTAKSQNK